jgi:Xaa-Pro aminopeptidase
MSSLFVEKVRAETPRLMAEQGLDVWVTFTREFAPDPMASLLGLDNVIYAAAVFAREGDQLRATVMGSRLDHALLNRFGLFDEVLFPDRPPMEAVAELAERHGAKTVVVNTGPSPLADGLSYTQFKQLSKALRSRGIGRPVSSFELIFALRSCKSEGEVAALREAARISHRIMLDALTPRVIQPGRTTEQEIADFVLGRAGDAGLATSWDAAYCPIVSAGETREHAAPSPDIIVWPGDLVIIDFGVSVDGYGADLQRCAYVTRPGETGAPPEIQRLFDTCLAGIDLGLGMTRPGFRAGSVDKAVRDHVLKAGYPDYPNATGHPIGLVVHELGPAIAPMKKGRGLTRRRIEEDQVFTMEPSVYMSLEPGRRVRVGLEEDFVVTAAGADVLCERQTELILL